MSNPSDISQQINQLLQQAAEKIACGPDCQQQKQNSELYKAYLNSETNYLTASEQVTVAAKNYYTTAHGAAAYNDYNKSQLSTTAELITQKLSNMFDEQISNAYSFNNLYNSTWINAQNTVELHKHYKTENVKLTGSVTNKNADVYTNGRRSYYENEQIEILDWWHVVEMWIYIILVIVFIVFSIFGKPNRSRRVIFFSIILMIIYPFISTSIVLYFITFVKWFFSFFPKNVYL